MRLQLERFNSPAGRLLLVADEKQNMSLRSSPTMSRSADTSRCNTPARKSKNPPSQNPSAAKSNPIFKATSKPSIKSPSPAAHPSNSRSEIPPAPFPPAKRRPTAAWPPKSAAPAPPAPSAPPTEPTPSPSSSLPPRLGGQTLTGYASGLAHKNGSYPRTSEHPAIHRCPPDDAFSFRLNSAYNVGSLIPASHVRMPERPSKPFACPKHPPARILESMLRRAKSPQPIQPEPFKLSSRKKKAECNDPGPHIEKHNTTSTRFSAFNPVFPQTELPAPPGSFFKKISSCTHSIPRPRNPAI